MHVIIPPSSQTPHATRRSFPLPPCGPTEASLAPSLVPLTLSWLFPQSELSPQDHQSVDSFTSVGPLFKVFLQSGLPRRRCVEQPSLSPGGF